MEVSTVTMRYETEFATRTDPMVGAVASEETSMVKVVFKSRSNPPSSTFSLRVMVERMPVTAVDPMVTVVPVCPCKTASDSLSASVNSDIDRGFL